ncbi:hypothetical protein LEN26_019668 [Aphanomyces euteiches]|nr:hypothetical protein LEN26_019668 [Aphanomyces euteiches]KAH9181838.1 hypothetical protein AeNC1_016186 [Aphanomyces euteiches]
MQDEADENNVGTQRHQTSLHEAAYTGDLDAIMPQPDTIAKVNAVVGERNLSLDLAIRSGHLDVVKYLRKIWPGDSFEFMSEEELYVAAFTLLASNDGHFNVVKHLIDKGAKINVVDRERPTPLHLASNEGYIDVAKHLVDNRADVDAADIYGRAPLHLASQRGHLDVVKHLIDIGADINAVDKIFRLAPLDLALRKGHLDVVMYLAPIRAPMHLALRGKHLDVVMYLVDKGADINAIDKERRTPLHLTSNKGYIDVVKHLVNKGADDNITDKFS